MTIIFIIVLEDLEMFEVKQGPYAGDNDKIKLNSVRNLKG